MTLKYESERCKIYQGDCLTILSDVEEADCLITDPPYGISYKSNMSDNHCSIIGDDSSDLATKGLSLAAVKLKPFRHLYCFGVNPDGVHDQITNVVELVWDKENMAMGNLRLPWSKSHEVIYFATRIPSKANRARGDGRLSARLRRGSILSYPRLNSMQNRKHPTQKPVGLLRQLVESSTSLGEVVLDPFAGVGSVGVAAILSGRRAVLIELESKFVEIAIQRMELAEKLYAQVEAA